MIRLGFTSVYTLSVNDEDWTKFNFSKYENIVPRSRVEFQERNSGGTHSSNGKVIRGIRVGCDPAWMMWIMRISGKTIPWVKALVYRLSGIISASFCVDWISHAADLSAWLGLELVSFLITSLIVDVLDSFPLSMVTQDGANKSIKFSLFDTSSRSQVESTAAANILPPFPFILFLLGSNTFSKGKDKPLLGPYLSNSGSRSHGVVSIAFEICLC